MTYRNMKLSEHFNLSELVATSHDKYKLANRELSKEQKDKLKWLCTNVLEPIRVHFRLPMTITSGFRMYGLNRSIGGAPTSQHTLCEAADFIINGLDDMEGSLAIFDWVRASDLPYGQVIHEVKRREGRAASIWIHISSGIPYRDANKVRLAYLFRNGDYISISPGDLSNDLR